MDDIGKALVMVGHIILFILACTVSLYLYNNIITHIDVVMLSKDFSNQGDSITGTTDTNVEREILPAEVVLSILDLKEKSSGNSVIVNGDEYTYNQDTNRIELGMANWVYNSSGLYSHLRSEIIAPNRIYRLTYTENCLEYEFY